MNKKVERREFSHKGRSQHTPGQRSEPKGGKMEPFKHPDGVQMFKLDLEKAEEPEIRLPTSAGLSKKQESFRKTSASLTAPKPLTVWITTNCGKFFK